MSKIEFPDWFDLKKLEALASLERAGGGAIISLLRDTFVSSTSQMLQVLPEWGEDSDPGGRSGDPEPACGTARPARVAHGPLGRQGRPARAAPRS